MLRRVITKIKNLNIIKTAYKFIFKMVGSLSADPKLIVFESFLGKQYSCNPRAIYEYLNQTNSDYKMYWSIDPRFRTAFDDKGVQTVDRFSIKWLLLMARAKYWVTNSRMPLWIPKPNHTIYLQTWHGTPLKRLAADMDQVLMPGTDTEQYKRNFLAESSRWDYLISPNRYSTEIFRRAFGFEKEMLETGYPRNDFIINENKSELLSELKEKLNLSNDKKIILYAPTWRDNEFHSKGKYKFKLKLNLKHLQEQLGDEYIILLRMHYLIADQLDLSEYEGFAYDVSRHEDIRELYLISDILLTDYSSVFFDFANLKRPMIFYVYDIESYRDQLRGFYFEFEKEAPGPLVKTTEEVVSVIKQLELGSYTPPENFEHFYQKFCSLEDGDATKRVVDKLFI